MIDKFMSFGENKLGLLQSTRFQCFAYKLGGADKVLLYMDILK